jgi:hypothetical protein
VGVLDQYLEALNHRRHSANSITGMKLWPHASSIIARPRSIPPG